MKFNPFNLIGDEWMLVTAGNKQSGCNTMTASWGHLGCLWGHNDPTAVIYLRPLRYTKKFVDEEPYFTLCVMDKSFKKPMAYLGSVSGRDEDKIGKAGLTPSMPITPSISRKPSWYLFARSSIIQNFRRADSFIRTLSTRTIPSVTSIRCTSARLRMCW